MIRRIAVIALVLPFSVWYWPQWATRDLLAAYRQARRDRHAS